MNRDMGRADLTRAEPVEVLTACVVGLWGHGLLQIVGHRYFISIPS